MNSNNWRRLTGVAMGVAIALALIMAVSYIADTTDQQEISGPAATSRAAS